jgi:hypothetical protein
MVAKPAYLSRLSFSALPRVALYCVPGGVRVVSMSLSYSRSTGVHICSFSTPVTQASLGSIWRRPHVSNQRRASETPWDSAEKSRI